MIRLALSQRICSSSNGSETRDCLDERLTQLLMSIGMLPVPMPNFARADRGETVTFDDWLGEIRPSGVILTGGDDPRVRDRRWWAERALVGYARFHELPLLGICRGMQRLTLEDGGTIEPVKGHVAVQHVVTARREAVNSFHEFAVVDLPRTWRPIAHADDGVLEAMTHVALPWQGWMWHPERESPYAEEDVNELLHLFGGGRAS